VLRWFAATATTPRRTVAATNTQTHVIAALEQHGYRSDGSTEFFSYQSRSLAELPEPVLPPGFRARPMRGPADIPIRLAGNLAAWPDSRITEDSYRAVMAAWPYRADLDWMVEAPDGAAAANCLIWLDEHNRVGLLEPVGTDPRFRRMGIGRAVCLAAMHAARAAGAIETVVYPIAGGGHDGAIPLYASLGFTPYARGRTYIMTDG
jgi:GNAT superfamily N-acetyltransferase